MLYRTHHHHVLSSFPTRRSSDLPNSSPRAKSDVANFAGSPERSLNVWVTVLRFIASSSPDPEMPPRASSKALPWGDRKSTRLNSSHVKISYAVFCLKKKKTHIWH